MSTKNSRNYITVVSSEDLGFYTKIFPKDISEDEFYYRVSNRISMSDCTGEEILTMVYHGQEVKYYGWEPNEHFIYKDLNGNTVYEAWYPEFDH